MKLKSSVTEWRPPLGTRIKILQHKDWAGHDATVTIHKTWMSIKTMDVEVDKMGAIAGITGPDQFEVTDMTQVEFGSPEAQVVLEKDKKLEKNEGRVEWLKREIKAEIDYINALKDELHETRIELEGSKSNLTNWKKELKELVT